MAYKWWPGERKPEIRLSSNTVDFVMAYETKDKDHNWPMYQMVKIEAAIKKHGYIPLSYYYKRFDTITEELVFDAPFIESIGEFDYRYLSLRLKIADRCYKIMVWFYLNFRPK